jgi:hypothetical protein
MAMFLGNAFAQKTVTIDFDNDYQTLFPTLKGVSSGSGDSYVGDGDFTEATTSTPVDGVMVIVAPAEDASNPSRIWASSPRLRMYSGTFTVLSSGLPITKIEFNAHSKNFNLKPTDGSLSEERVFTGATMSAIFMVEKNTQISSIVVTLGEGGTTPDNPDNPNNSGLLSKFDLTSGSIADNGDQTVFEFTGLAKMGESEENKINVSGKVLFDFENELCSACKAFVTFPSEVIAALAEIDAKANAEKEGYDSVERDGATLIVVSSRDFLGYSRILIKSMIKMLIDNEQGGLGILESPMSPNQANIFAGSLEKDKVYDQDIYIKGKIASIKYEFSAQYGTATFFISADGQNDFTFQCYSVNYLENKAWVEGNTQIKVGDEVIICGKVVNYKGNTPETSSKKAYIYSLNGKTKEEGGEDPDPQDDVTTATCAEILAGTDGTFYRVTGKCVEIANTTYGNWYLEDATGRLYIYGTLDKEGNAGKNNSIDVWGIEVGDELTVEGERTTYKETVELKNVKVLNIKKAAAEGKVWDFTKWSDATIANLKADAAASKTAGWSDVEKKDVAEADGEPTETSKDNCFWSVAEPNADGTLSANGVVIEELKGLVWNSTYSTARSLAIAVNYPVALSEYAGGAYLWLGGGKKKIPCFTIPDVKAGSTITMEVESHKTSEGRGVELYTGLDADNLVDAATKIGDTFAPKTKEAHSWTIDKDCDVIVYNTNGCHIYKIEITAGTTAIKALKTAKIGDGYIFNLAGQRVDANYKGVVIKDGQKLIQK